MPTQGNSIRAEPIARIELRGGHWFLTVADVVVAMQGDPLRDPRIVYDEKCPNNWSKESLQHAADWINVRTRGGPVTMAIGRGQTRLCPDEELPSMWGRG